jgi:hypothetical protein
MQSFMIYRRKVENPNRNRIKVRKDLSTISVVPTDLIYIFRRLLFSNCFIIRVALESALYSIQTD